MRFRTETKNKTSLLKVIKPRVTFWDDSTTVLHNFKISLIHFQNYTTLGELPMTCHVFQFPCLANYI